MDYHNRLLILLLLLLSCGGLLSAQKDALGGTVVDVESGVPIAYANVTVGLASSDPYRIESFAVSDFEGKFQLKLQRDSVYILQISYLGYRTSVDTLNASSLPNDYIVSMQPATNNLSTVEVTYKLPIRVSGDTVSYAADAFTDGNERKLEDILKKLPGFAVDDSGQISVNGKKVEGLKVDGKDFFGGNSKLAARSLPADAVDRIDVLNNYSDGEQMGQFADGRGTALNIRLREDKKNLVFGEIYGGYGPNAETDLGTDAFYFGPTTSINFIANHNDIGRQVLTYSDMFRLNGGFAKDRGAGAVNFSPAQFGLGSDPELNAGRSTELAVLSAQYQPNQQFNASGTLLYGNNRNQNISNSLRTVLGQDAITSVEQAENSIAGNRSLSGLLRLDYQVSKAFSLSYRAIAGNGMLGTEADTRVFIPSQSVSSLSQEKEQRNNNIRQQLRLRYGKTERELWIWRIDQERQGLTGTYDVESDELPFNFTDTSSIGQNNLRQKQDNQISTYGTRADYYRSLNNSNQINLYAGVRREESLFNAELTAAGEAVAGEGTALNDRFEVNSAYTGVGHRLQVKKWKFSPGLRFERSFWRENAGESISTGSRSFLLPQAEVRYDIRKSSSVSLSYEQSVSWPGAERRTAALVLRDLYSLTTGTSQLREALHHSLSLSYYNYNLFDQVTYSAGLTLSRMERPLTQQITLGGTEQLVTSVNADRPGDLISAYFQMDKYLEHFKFSGSLQNSLAVSQVFLEERMQLNRNISSTIRINMRTRFKKQPNMALGGRLTYGNYRAGTQDARRYLSLEPTVRVYGDILPRLSFNSEYRFRSYRQVGSEDRNVLDRLEASLRFDSKGKRFSYELSGHNLLNRSVFQRESFSDFLLNLNKNVILGRRLILKVSFQL